MLQCASSSEHNTTWTNLRLDDSTMPLSVKDVLMIFLRYIATAETFEKRQLVVQEMKKTYPPNAVKFAYKQAIERRLVDDKTELYIRLTQGDRAWDDSDNVRWCF